MVKPLKRKNSGKIIIYLHQSGEHFFHALVMLLFDIKDNIFAQFYVWRAALVSILTENSYLLFSLGRFIEASAKLIFISVVNLSASD